MGIAPVEDGLLVYLHCFKGKVVCISGAGFLIKYVTTFSLRNRNGDWLVGATKGTRTGRISCRDMGRLLTWVEKTTLDVNFFLKVNGTSRRHTTNAHMQCFLVRFFFFFCVCVFLGGLFVEFPWYYSPLMIWEFHGISSQEWNPWMLDSLNLNL